MSRNGQHDTPLKEPVTIGPVREVAVKDIQKPNRRPSKYDGLVRDLLLRLEQTPKTHALEIQFASLRDARVVKVSLQKAFIVERGSCAVTIRQRGGVLYISRGKNWGR
ncbi:MAG: hypothetical protein JW910_09410 [Anaerolineae bacterium]|nr:hypothetical protein [Anaerolineae bacterium]